MVITCQGYTQQVREGFPGGAVPLVTDGGVLQEAVAAAGNQTEKEERELMKPAVQTPSCGGPASLTVSPAPKARLS